MRVDLCPDAKGNVPVRVTLKGGYALNGGGSSWSLDIRATGHVGDNGRLATSDVRWTASVATTPPPGAAGGQVGKFVEVRSRYTAKANGDVDKRGPRVEVPRWSSKADRPFAEAAARFGTGLAATLASLGIGSAEDQWTNGYCVAITVPEVTETRRESNPTGQSIELPYKAVDAGSKTPFTAVVLHKWEGKELHVPVAATLTSGKVSVKPSGTAVRAPARFTYTAPDKRGEAYVRLETKSKRGIATLTVVFATVLHQGWAYGRGSPIAHGLKCDVLGGDWVVDGHFEAGGVVTTQKWVVTIDDTTFSGTYTYDSRQTGPDSVGTWHGTGGASIVVQPDGSVAMSFHGGTQVITLTGPGGTTTETAPGFEGQMFLWMPAGNECH